MKKMMQSLVMAAFVANCLIWSTGFAAQQNPTGDVTRPPSATQTVQTPSVQPLSQKAKARGSALALICASLSSQINQDKEQLSSVIGYLNEFGCLTTTPTVSYSQCRALEMKKVNLEARITANINQARERGCTE